MEKNQKINCNVKSCEYNNYEHQKCNLNEIKICNCPGCTNVKSEDESMCASYKCQK